MPSRLDLQDALVPVWRTTNRVTVFLIEQLSPELLDAKVPGVPRKTTVSTIVAHIHNSRCSWIRTLGRSRRGIAVPEEWTSGLRVEGISLKRLAGVATRWRSC